MVEPKQDSKIPDEQNVSANEEQVVCDDSGLAGVQEGTLNSLAVQNCSSMDSGFSQLSTSASSTAVPGESGRIIEEFKDAGMSCHVCVCVLLCACACEASFLCLCSVVGSTGLNTSPCYSIIQSSTSVALHTHHHHHLPSLNNFSHSLNSIAMYLC